MIFIVLFCFLWHKKGGLICVILAHAPQYFMGTNCTIVCITTNRTRDLGLKGDKGIQPLRHTHKWCHRGGLIFLYLYAFKGNGKTSYTFTAL